MARTDALRAAMLARYVRLYAFLREHASGATFLHEVRVRKSPVLDVEALIADG